MYELMIALHRLSHDSVNISLHELFCQAISPVYLFGDTNDIFLKAEVWNESD